MKQIEVYCDLIKRYENKISKLKEELSDAESALNFALEVQSRMKEDYEELTKKDYELRTKMEKMGISIESSVNFPIILSTVADGHRVSVRYQDMDLEECFEHFKNEIGENNEKI